MTKNDILNEYFEWMCHFVYDEINESNNLSYRKLLAFLQDTVFAYTIPMDGNRYEDGIGLRYRFGYESGYSDSLIACELDDHPCSMLEMMIALSIRLEEHIMGDPAVGNRTGQWFWNMVVSLGLYAMDDTRFNKKEAVDIIQKFLNHDYDRNGKGGLFTIEHTDKDMRTAEIWNQANWYLNQFFYD